MASKAIPSHLKTESNGKVGDSDFARRHHGKTQSHVVSNHPVFATLLACLPALSRLVCITRQLSMRTAAW